MRQMKDSGIEWIGKIPQDWDIERIQWHLEEVNEINNPIQTTYILSLNTALYNFLKNKNRVTQS